MKKIIVLVTAILSFTACDFQSKENNSKPPQGELANTFMSDTTSIQAPPETTVQSEDDRLRSEGWEVMNMTNGVLPDCYNYRPGYGKLANELIINTGGGTDVAIKVMSFTGTCVRYVFINSNSTYAIRNFPEDRYYLKIAYGKNWISKNESGRCSGRFLHQAMYKKGEDELDFNRQVTAGGYNIPSFELSLDVISGMQQDSFQSSGITESEFNE